MVLKVYDPAGLEGVSPAQQVNSRRLTTHVEQSPDRRFWTYLALEFVDCFPEPLALRFEFGILLDQIFCRDLQSVLELFGKILLKIRALFLGRLRQLLQIVVNSRR